MFGLCLATSGLSCTGSFYHLRQPIQVGDIFLYVQTTFDDETLIANFMKYQMFFIMKIQVGHSGPYINPGNTDSTSLSFDDENVFFLGETN